MSRHRIDPAAGWVHDYGKLPRGPNGRALCRRCGTEVPKGSRTFCSSACVHEWKIRTQPGYVRSLVRERDHGVCAACGLDCGAIERVVGILEDLWRGHVPVRLAWRFESRWRDAEAARRYREFAAKVPMGAYRALRRYRDGLAARGFRTSGRSYWHADHIVPVVEGGGGCGLDNYRTLCLPCHRRVTAELRRRLAGAPKPRQAELAIDATNETA